MTRYHPAAAIFASLLILLLVAPVALATDDTPPPQEVEEVDPDGLEGIDTRPGLNDKIEIGEATPPSSNQPPFFKTFAILRTLWKIRVLNASIGF